MLRLPSTCCDHGRSGNPIADPAAIVARAKDTRLGWPTIAALARDNADMTAYAIAKTVNW